MQRTETQAETPTPAPDDGTPTTNPAAALHWAAEAYNHAARREAQGRYLNTDEQTNYQRYQSAARSHGYTEQQVRVYAASLLPAQPEPPRAPLPPQARALVARIERALRQ